MKTAILSAGPSLPLTYDPAVVFDMRIAVNGAAKLYPCDWWSCCDHRGIELINPLRASNLLTMTLSNSGYQRPVVAQKLVGMNVRTCADVATDAPKCWRNWSVTMALVLAVEQGSRDVHVYGHDMRGDTDCTGRKCAKRRLIFSRDHQSNVPTDWAAVRRWAQQTGVRVFEHQPAGYPEVQAA